MSIIRISILVVLSAVLGACGILSEEDENVLDIARQLLQEQKNEYGEAMKVDLPIRVNYSIYQKPIVGHDLSIELEFIAERKIPILRIGLGTTDGLELITYVKERYLDVAARQIIKKEVIVVPTEENLFYLNLFVVTEIGEDRRAKHIKIPIALGEYSLKKKSR